MDNDVAADLRLDILSLRRLVEHLWATMLQQEDDPVATTQRIRDESVRALQSGPNGEPLSEQIAEVMGKLADREAFFWNSVQQRLEQQQESRP